MVLVFQSVYRISAYDPRFTVDLGPYILRVRIDPDVCYTEDRLRPQSSRWIDCTIVFELDYVGVADFRLDISLDVDNSNRVLVVGAPCDRVRSLGDVSTLVEPSEVPLNEAVV